MLRYATWDRVKSKCQHYRRRSPDTTNLYRIVYHHRERLEYEWEARFQQTYGFLRNEVQQVLDEYLNCGLLEHGAARVYCDSCKHSLFVAFSCKKRGICPSCGAKRAVKFAEHLHNSVLEDVDHRHLVFSIPKRLRPYFRYNRKLCSILFQAAWQSLREYFSEGEVGVVLTLQTAGESLNWNPHLHGFVTDVCWGDDNQPLSISEIDTATIEFRFAELVLTALCKHELIDDAVMSQILSQQHSGFSFWLGEPFNDAESDKFVARYVERGPLSLEKLAVADDNVSYSTKDGVTHNFDALQFLAGLSSHVPNTYESVTRYYGRYSCRKRGKRLKQQVLLNSQEPQKETLTLLEPKKKPAASWARCIKQVYEVNPLECPRCKSEMRVVAFLIDPVEIKKIMKSQGIPQFRAPPAMHKPPAHDDAELNDITHFWA